MFAFIEIDQVVKWPVSLGELRNAFPAVSFPVDLQDSDLAGLGVVRVEPSPQPDFDAKTEQVIEVTPAKVDLKWVQQWQVVQLSDAQKHTAKAIREEVLRRERNNFLAGCDWTQLADSQVDKQAWALYRQALRDLPQSAGFPWDYEWPTVPGYIPN
jgi:hypothetical protein